MTFKPALSLIEFLLNQDFSLHFLIYGDRQLESSTRIFNLNLQLEIYLNYL